MSNQDMLSYTQHNTREPLNIVVILSGTGLYLLAENYRFFQGISLSLTSRNANITCIYHVSCPIRECITIIVLDKAIYRHEPSPMADKLHCFLFFLYCIIIILCIVLHSVKCTLSLYFKVFCWTIQESNLHTRGIFFPM